MAKFIWNEKLGKAEKLKDKSTIIKETIIEEKVGDIIDKPTTEDISDIPTEKKPKK